MIQILRIGSKVKIGGSIPATILSAQIYAARNVRYEVVYWDGRKRMVEWLQPSEIDADNHGDCAKVGFANCTFDGQS